MAKSVVKNNADAKLKRVNNKLNSGVKAEILKLAQMGQLHAQMIAPKDTGLLRAHIVYRQLGNGHSAEIVSKNTLHLYPGEPRNRTNQNFSLPIWFALGGYSSTGVSRYMETTLHMLRNEAPKNIRVMMKTIKY